MVAHNTKQLEAMLEKELRRAMKKASEQALKDMKEETADYYDGTEPSLYVRTHALERTPKRTPIESDGDTMYFEAYLNQQHHYTSGDRPYMGQVLDLANYGKPWVTASGNPARPTVGKKGFWERAEKKVKKSFERIIKDQFK